MEDLPRFMRKLIAERLGVKIETIDDWIDGDDAAAHELIEESIIFLSEVAKDEQRLRSLPAAHAFIERMWKIDDDVRLDAVGTQSELIDCGLAGNYMFRHLADNKSKAGRTEFGDRYELQRRTKGEFKLYLHFAPKPKNPQGMANVSPYDTDISDILKRLQSNRPVIVRVSRSKGGGAS